MKEFSNELTTMVQQEYYTADGLTADSQIAKDPSSDLPEPSKICKVMPIQSFYMILRSYFN